ncbi:MAG: Spy/CpxP family protein refolding chaperone [Bryobacterales bacterium]|nr:Spy/CpxP family protein refolding chaperone [Bryobacterales bacterium]
MNKRTLRTAGLAILLTATFAFAQGPGRIGAGGPGGKGGPGGGHFAGRGDMAGNLLGPVAARLLDLTDAQKEAIRAETQAAREAAQPLREQMRAVQQQIAEAVHSGASDSTLESLASQAGTLTGNLQAISLKSRSKIHNTILTAEQRAKLEEIRAEMRNRRADRPNRLNRRQPNAPPAGPPAAPQAPNGI